LRRFQKTLGSDAPTREGAVSGVLVESFPYNHAMALVVFLRGVNVGGHKTFRPSMLVKALSAYDVVNVGAAGTFVVRKPGRRGKFLAELHRRLPFETQAMLCDGRDLLALEQANPFAAEPPRPDITRFVSVLAKSCRHLPALPVSFPPDGPWLLRVISCEKRFVCGVYRRQMKSIGYLGRIDKLFGSPATTRNWNTIAALVKILKSPANRAG
jgi:uncharacterized protein (DUF1697 family)